MVLIHQQTPILLLLLVAQCRSQIPLIPQLRTTRGVAANVAASTSSKSSHRSYMQFSQGPTKSYTDSFDEPPNTYDDARPWSETFMPEERLVAQLLHRRSLAVRPNGYNNQSNNPVHVNITYNVVQILAFSQAEETLSISGWFTIKWRDPRLSWDPEAFDNIREVNVQSNKLWIPDVGVMNGKSSSDFDFSAGARSRLTVNSLGEVTWMHGAVLDTTCPLDVSFFPFDYQTCFLILTPWQSSEQQLLLRPFTHGSAVDNSYLPNSNVSEWEIQSVHFASKKYRSDLNVTYQYVSIGIHLRRQPLYFVVLVLVPFSMLSALACLIFTLDDTGDRLSVALSLVLSMTMYVVIVSSNAPRSMRTLPVLGIFLLDQLGLLSIATVLAVINNKLYSSNELIDWQDWVYVISGTGEGKVSDGASLARRYSARVRQIASQKHSTPNTGRSKYYQPSDVTPTNHYYPRWWTNQTDCSEFQSKKKEGHANRRHSPESSWFNRHFRSRESNTSAANSEAEEDSLSERFDANFHDTTCPSESSIKGLPRQSRSMTNRNGMTRITPFQYGHHPLCNNVTGFVNSYVNDATSIPASIPVKLTNNCSSCANKFHQPTSPRSPWVEPLRHEHQFTMSPGRLSSQSSDSDASYTSSSPARMLKTTITATAAATLAATRVLNGECSLNGEMKRRIGSRQSNHPWKSRVSTNHSTQTGQYGSTNTLDQDSQTPNAVHLAAAAVSAAFRAAAIVNNKPHKGTYDSYRRNQGHRDTRPSRGDRPTINQMYPYRKLAARLDCIEMIAYLLLSTINAIVCLLIMPRFTQDPLPPKNWIT